MMMDNAPQLAASLHFTPVVSLGLLALLAVIGVALLVMSMFYHRRGLGWRCLMFALFMLVLASPSILKEERNYTKDVAAILFDQSASQNFGQRMQRSERALSYVQKALEQSGEFDVRVVRAPADQALSNRTDLFSELDQALADVPAKRRAGVIVISDGQIHDIPDALTHKDTYGPVHLLLSGDRGEKDRRIVVTNASAYGLVGKNISVTYRVEDTNNIAQSEAHVTLQLNDGAQSSFYVPVNVEQTLSLPVTSAGQNIFTLSVDGVSDEITLANNKTALLVNGVRDRLKVLLISGVPHSGERTWRDLLTSDPGVDLVHFTILREPQKMDYTPKKELSLIAFPFNELFNVKLHDFDLVIFDQYRVNNILPDIYFQNIVRYVRMGGAFLSSNGPAFAGRSSIYDTPLGEILPASPTGHITEEKYTPTVTDLGHQHPVTRDIIWNNKTSTLGEKEPWGDWLRYIDIKANNGDVLMNAGSDNRPLLVLNRVDKGRVAQLSSDQIWLWSRGYDGGGPHAEVLRRIVHWLMKEPELDERAFDVRVNKNQIVVEKQSFDKKEETLSVQLPDGETELITLKENTPGMLSYKMNAESLGIYAFEDTEGLRKFAIIGDIDPPELDGVITSDKLMEPLVTASGGNSIWLSEDSEPDLLHSLRRNDDFTVSRIKDIALLPEWVSLLILLCGLLLLWWREGQN